jgi:hypothetical protein
VLLWGNFFLPPLSPHCGFGNDDLQDDSPPCVIFRYLARCSGFHTAWVEAGICAGRHSRSTLGASFATPEEDKQVAKAGLAALTQ